MFRTLIAVFSLLLLLAPGPEAMAQTPPQVTAGDQAQAQRIAAMSKADATARVNQLLEARKLTPGGMFALAGTDPGLVEQLMTEKFELPLAYIDVMPAPEVHRIRRGETVIRTRKSMNRDEEKVALEICEAFEFKKCEKRLAAIAIGPYEGRVVRLTVTTTKDESSHYELAWPSTPTRDEKSRDLLAKQFGARPSRTSTGVGALVPLQQGSFEDENALGTTWQLEDGVVLSVRSPDQQVEIETGTAIDGARSVRFYGTDKTRLFYRVAQSITMAPYTRLKATCQLKTENIRPEFQQHDGDVYLEMAFLDVTGSVIGQSIVARGHTATHTWEELEVMGTAPPNTYVVRIGLVSAMSGTSWFDGVVLEIAP